MRVRLLQALIPAVAQTLGRFVEPDLAALEEPEIMLPSATLRRADHLQGLPVDHELRLERVPLLLAAVAAPLFFWGRSIGISLASTTTCPSPKLNSFVFSTTSLVILTTTIF